VTNVILNLSKNKTSGLDGLNAEHLQYYHPSVIMVCAKLINLMLIYEHVLDTFGQSVTNPLPKGYKMRCSSISEDYRGILVSPILFKVLELCIIKLFDKYLNSSRQQFGFKCQSVSCHALYSLHKTVE